MKTKKTTKKVDEATYKSFDGMDLSKIPGSAAHLFTANWEKFNTCKTAQDVIDLCHEIFDGSGLDTAWTRKFFYNLDQIVQNNPNPRRALEKALNYVSSARFRGMGLGMNSRRFHEDENNASTLYVIEFSTDSNDASNGIIIHRMWGTYDYNIAYKILDKVGVMGIEDYNIPKKDIYKAINKLKQNLKLKRDSIEKFTVAYDENFEPFDSSYKPTIDNDIALEQSSLIAVYVNPTNIDINDIEIIDAQNVDDNSYYVLESQHKKMYTTKSGKTYTKKQICEAIKYWKKQLNESYAYDSSNWCGETNDSAPVACDTMFDEPDGDGRQVFVAPNLKSFVDTWIDIYTHGFFDGVNDDCVVFYKGSAVSAKDEYDKFYKVMQELKNTSLKNGSVSIVIAGSFDEDDETKGQWKFNFKELDLDGYPEAEDIYYCK